MNAKSKFSIPILSGTRPEVGLFSATVAAPSLRNASNLVSGVPVSSHPMITTGVTSNNSIFPADQVNLDPEYLYPGTNTLLAYAQSGQLNYMDASKKTIQLDYSQNVTGLTGVGVPPSDQPSQMMIEYLATGKLEGGRAKSSQLNVSGVLATSTNTQSLDLDSRLPAELYDCSPEFNDVTGVEPVTAATEGANYQQGLATARMVYFTDKDGIVGTHATGFVIGTFAINATGNVTNPIQTGATALLDNSIQNIPVGGALTVEDGQAAAAPTLIFGGVNYTPNAGIFPVPFLSCTTKVISQGPNPSSVSGQPGQGIIVRVSTNAGGGVTAVNVIDNDGSGYNVGDILELFDGQLGQGALVSIGSVNKAPSSGGTGTLATAKVTSQYRPGSGAPIGPYDSY
ncbi:hypothetical protein KA005_64475, partial [bacterium]|nr:hypothetical protein [bacterium]